MNIDTDEAMNRHYIPDGVEYSGQHNMAVTQDWLQGWDACKELADAFPAPQPAECEPVAWMNPYGGIVQTRRTGLEHETYTLPLYTTPQPCPRCAELEQDLQTNADALAEAEQIRLGLQNCRLFAARHRNEDWALLILGFCAEAGEVGSITR